MKTRVAIYARVSTKDGRQDVTNQLAQLRKFAASQKWEMIHEYIDQASGKRGDRDQLNKMLDAASRHEFDVLLFWSLDRLSREGVVETLNYLQRLTGYGVNYRSYTEQYLDSTGIFKEAIIGILAAIAKQEHIRLSERTLAGLERARKQGHIGGRPRKDADPAVMKKLHLLRSQNRSIRYIAAKMNLSNGTVHRLVKIQSSDLLATMR
jgi:DNA invertase Pin-like site-specific DNA recombinase